MKVRRAVLSVHDKTGLVEFARGLAALGVELLSTGGTAAALRDAGLSVVDVSQFTGFPEMLGGRVKTLHPKVHGGILGRRHDPSHVEQMAAHGIAPIDLVCVNLYPFEKTVARGCTRDEAIEQIDIGGPAMIRSASKNHESVAVVTSPRQYGAVLEKLHSGEGGLPEDFLADLAAEAFRTTAAYDAAIAAYLGGDADEAFPEFDSLLLAKVRGLRYGENPTQRAAVYVERGASGPSVASAAPLGGKELSYNNLLDLDAALRIVREFDSPCCAVIKHTNPCGAALGATAAEAWTRAHASDPVSAFGCVVGFNVPVDAAAAARIGVPENFVECIVAPSFAPQAVEALTNGAKWGKNLRLVAVGDVHAALSPRERNVRRILGGLLVQDYDVADGAGDAEVRTMSKRAPSDDERRDLAFAWRICKYVLSNAIVLVKNGQVVGVGGGQTSRVDAAEIAVRKAGERAKGAVMASDAFFPFADGLEVGLRAGVTAAIEPGGSVRDADVVAAADRAGAALVFTGIRHFRHG